MILVSHSRAMLYKSTSIAIAIFLVLSLSLAAAAAPAPQSPHQQPFLTLSNTTTSTTSTASTASTASAPPLASLSYTGLHINTPPTPPPPYLTLSTSPLAELDASTAVLVFSPVHIRTWEDVTLRRGGRGGVEACQVQDMAESLEQGNECRASIATPDGRALFRTSAGTGAGAEGDECQPLVQLYAHQYKYTRAARPETLLSFRAHLRVEFQPTSPFFGQIYTQDFWLAHLRRDLAAWPLDNAPWAVHGGNGTGVGLSDNATDAAIDAALARRDIAWTGTQPNRIAALFQDPYLPRAEHPLKNDRLNGVDVSFARWNLGISLRLPPPPPPPPATRPPYSVLLPVHSPVSGQVVYASLYRRANAPSSHLNDEQAWLLSIRDEWGFVWHLFGVSPYHQRVYLGAWVARGDVLGRVSTRPRLPLDGPRDREPPADPPPPDGGREDGRTGGGGGDSDGDGDAKEGNVRYPYWFRELRLSVARPSPDWTEWPHPYADDDGRSSRGSHGVGDGLPGWTWYDPLHFLPRGTQARAPLPPYLAPSTIFFAHPATYAPSPPTVFAQAQARAQARVSSREEAQALDVAEVKGDVEIIVGVRAFTAGFFPEGSDDDGGESTTAASSSAFGLDPVSVYKLEWALRPFGLAADEAGDDTPASTSACACGGMQEQDWRPAFEHSRLPHAAPPLAHSNAESGPDSDSLWKYVVPAFTSPRSVGRFPIPGGSARKWASQFDWKARALFYPLTRTLPRGTPSLSHSHSHSHSHSPSPSLSPPDLPPSNLTEPSSPHTHTPRPRPAAAAAAAAAGASPLGAGAGASAWNTRLESARGRGEFLLAVRAWSALGRDDGDGMSGDGYGDGCGCGVVRVRLVN